MHHVLSALTTLSVLKSKVALGSMRVSYGLPVNREVIVAPK